MLNENKKSFSAKENEVTRKCYVIDANNKILGRVAAKAATLLRGKHKAIYTPNVDTGDQVIIINAEKIRVTGKKLTDKIYARFSGYPSGRREVRLGDMLKKTPELVLELAVWRMIPKGSLGTRMARKLKVYKGDKHPHKAQKPIALEV